MPAGAAMPQLGSDQDQLGARHLARIHKRGSHDTMFLPEGANPPSPRVVNVDGDHPDGTQGAPGMGSFQSGAG